MNILSTTIVPTLYVLIGREPIDKKIMEVFFGSEWACSEDLKYRCIETHMLEEYANDAILQEMEDGEEGSELAASLSELLRTVNLVGKDIEEIVLIQSS
jgi:hypothetical protein